MTDLLAKGRPWARLTRELRRERVVTNNPVWTHALKRLQEAAPALGVKLQQLAVRDSGDLKMAFDAATRGRADALLVVREASFTAIRHQIASFAARHRLPAIYGGWYTSRPAR